jgi:hypothetical protein
VPLAGRVTTRPRSRSSVSARLIVPTATQCCSARSRSPGSRAPGGSCPVSIWLTTASTTRSRLPRASPRAGPSRHRCRHRVPRRRRSAVPGSRRRRGHDAVGVGDGLAFEAVGRVADLDAAAGVGAVDGAAALLDDVGQLGGEHVPAGVGVQVVGVALEDDVGADGVCLRVDGLGHRPCGCGSLRGWPRRRKAQVSPIVPAAFRKLDAITVLTGPLLPAPLVTCGAPYL